MTQFLLGLVLGGVAVWLVLRKPTVKQGGALEGFNKERNEKEEQNKQKILSAQDSQGQITNDDVQKLLGVSDSTATRYLDELEQEGKLKQVHEQGRGVYYQKP